MTTLKKAFFLFFFLVAYGLATAQETVFPSWDEFAGNWQIGVNLGPDFYYGDMNKKGSVISHNVSIAGGVFTTWQISNVFGLRGELLIGGLNGKNVSDNEPHRHFNGVFSDIVVCATIDFSNLMFRFNPFRKVHVYGTGGIGIISWSSSSYVNGNKLSGNNVAAIFPVGLGVFYTFANRLNIGVEWTTRVVTSDYLDQYHARAKLDFINYISFWTSMNFNQLKNIFKKSAE
ncbi:MAG: outer membrane beta-barrel protein [Bacteroidales bacterium]|nr:outer membrane beta-barrel protein [Bacteroidales bacterium]